jgi:Contact-dependent growth inhibition CdiA C-terminal domain
VADYSRAGLVAAAGVDPWLLAEQVRSGDPAGLQDAGVRVRRAGLLAAEAVDDGGRADRAVAEAFRNDGVAVFDAAASTRRGAVLLADQGEKVEEVARALLDVAAVLTETMLSTGSRISVLDADLRRIVGLRGGVQVSGPDPGAVAAGLAAAEQRYFGMAVEAVRSAGARIQGDLDGYDAVLANRTARLAGLGYGAASQNVAMGGGPERAPAVTDAAAVVVVPAPPPFGVIATVIATVIAVAIAASAAGDPDPTTPATEPEVVPQDGRIDDSKRPFSPQERAIAEKLSQEKRNVEAIPEAPPDKRPDALVDGTPTEFKTLDPTSSEVHHVGRAITRAEGQARDVIVDARGTTLSKEDAQDGIKDYVARKPGNFDKIRILTRDGDATYP